MARGKIYKRGQCVEFSRRGHPYVICFTNVAAAKAFKKRRASRSLAESKRIARTLPAKDRALLKKYGLA